MVLKCHLGIYNQSVDYNKNTVRLTLYSMYHFVLLRRKCDSVKTKIFQIITFIHFDKELGRARVACRPGSMTTLVSDKVHLLKDGGIYPRINPRHFIF
jgi:hypothetical protein